MSVYDIAAGLASLGIVWFILVLGVSFNEFRQMSEWQQKHAKINVNQELIIFVISIAYLVWYATN